MKDELDRERIEKLTGEISFAIRAHYMRGPVSRDRVFEALNALGYATAVVLVGSGDQTGEARQFFDKALSMSLETIKAEHNESDPD